ncbi:MAG: zeta toxin family protein [Eubacterium sp.]|nr:zeta toxin family protein [Eubacterium sp.]
MDKKYIITAGVNGAGKTTLFVTNDMYLDVPRVNLDEIVRSFGSWKNASDVAKAGMIAVKKIEQYFSEGVSFNQETTLCGKSIFRNIQRAKMDGYFVEMYYVGVGSSQIAKERVRQRVLDGGHGIPEQDIERRYIESLNNLKSVIKICDRIYVYDNTDRFEKIAAFEFGELVWKARKCPEWFKANINL